MSTWVFLWRRGAISGALAFPHGPSRDSYTIHVNGLKLDVSIGFHAVEQGVKQTIIADLALQTDFRLGPQEDRHTGLVDYYELERALRAHVSTKSYDLLEALAADLARQVIAVHPSVRVHVRVTKRPMDMAGLDSVSVECVRSKADFEA